MTGTPDGDEGLSKAALKNKKKREARKAKDAAEKSTDSSAASLRGGGIEDGSGTVRTLESRGREDRDGRSKGLRSRSRSDVQSRDPNQNWERRNPGATPSAGSGASKVTTGNSRLDVPTAPPQTSATPAPPDLSVTSPGGGSPHEKKLRGLLKKVRAIDDLKMRLAGGEKLEDTQMKKIGTEDIVRRELEALGYTG